jgi:hypothetical protein
LYGTCSAKVLKKKKMILWQRSLPRYRDKDVLIPH